MLSIVPLSLFEMYNARPSDYPNQIFTVLIWGDDRANVGQLPRSGRVCAAGTITEYRGTPEIVIRDAKSWYIPK